MIDIGVLPRGCGYNVMTHIYGILEQYKNTALIKHVNLTTNLSK